MQLNPNLEKEIQSLNPHTISEDRKALLLPLINYIQKKKNQNLPIRINFICTHNSRRSHLSQIWAQVCAAYFGIQNLTTYSGGTEATAMFPKISETLTRQGFEIIQLSHGENPVYSIKYAANEQPIIAFSKKLDHPFNPKSEFAAVMTCDSANEACPLVNGAEARFPITYEDPKKFDHTDLQDQMYRERSIQIATEMYFIFSQ